MDISNDISKLRSIYLTRMSDSTFRRFSSFIYNELGIKMPDTKKVMLESRLQKRLKDLGYTNFDEYLDFVFSPTGQETELIHMMDVVTTNKTDFFREPTHYDFLKSFVLPEFKQNNRGAKLNVWSAGCSSGEEPYTLAMVFNDAMEENLLFDYSIFATDISTRILQRAIDAVYHISRTQGIPRNVMQKYFLKSKNPDIKTVRIIPQLRNKIVFDRLNFMDDYYNVNQQFDIIFCRNVLIYFDRETQEKVINKLCTKLKQGGYFFFGHSESITGINVPLEHIKPTIFRKK
jgi:chemotaxis protein methyltransferase CheR